MFEARPRRGVESRLIICNAVPAVLNADQARSYDFVHFNNNSKIRVKNVLYSLSSSMLVFVFLGCGLHFGKPYDLQQAHMLTTSSL